MDFKEWFPNKYFETDKGVLIQDDCFNQFQNITDKSINLILADLPYGTTECKWDSILPLDRLWEQYNRIITDNGVIVLTASQPFTTTLINSNKGLFKYEWIWVKTRPTGFGNANHRPMKKHENVLVFSKANASTGSDYNMVYNPQGLVEKPRKIKRTSRGFQGERPNQVDEYTSKYTNYPTTVLEFASEGKTLHPTQKPLALFKYLISTYSDENMLVLDNTCGVLTTGLACEELNRNWICMELDKKYCEKGITRFNKNGLKAIS